MKKTNKKKENKEDKDKRNKRKKINNKKQHKKLDEKAEKNKEKSNQENHDIIENILIIKSVVKDIKKISDSYNLSKNINKTDSQIITKKSELEQKKNQIYKLNYIIYKSANDMMSKIT